MRFAILYFVPVLCVYASSQSRSKDKFEVLQHLGANGPWFPGSDVFNLGGPNELPEGCEVDRAVYISRHGSRYPDPGAWSEWNTLYDKIQAAEFTSHGSLSFLKSWKPVLQHPSDDIAQLSITGYKELYDMGTTLRFRYPNLYVPNTWFNVWANKYQRTIDSALVDSTNPKSIANSLATSDLCPLFKDDSTNQTVLWDLKYLPPILSRLQKLLKGNLTLTEGDVSLFPYLCGFETQIVGRQSKWCGVFTEDEILEYEYRQDLRYWYGTGLGSNSPTKNVMLPIVHTIANILSSRNLTTPSPLVVAFTHDNQINELASSSGIFDAQASLTTDRVVEGRRYVSSRITPMRGTISWERLSCKGRGYVRVRLNDAVYPVAKCSDGPGKLCPVEKYSRYIKEKVDLAGSFEERCNSTTRGVEGTLGSFFMDLGLEFLSVVQP
ncbi:multiple inositol polyphosphate phosphatase [Cyathus striatus]|nr:multiple inositol polyphosphate phosphatase [Cyathus striatus]